jgi:hypothetical protein
MNHPIKQMWEDATGSVWPRPGKFTAGEYDHNLEKFAQLLIKHVLDEVDDRASVIGDRSWSQDADRPWVELTYDMGSIAQQRDGK